jgi:S-adenosylmethionine hydrolase
MELNKENQHIVMQWNDSYFIAADNGILSMLSQKLFLKEWLLLISRSPVASDWPDVFLLF